MIETRHAIALCLTVGAPLAEAAEWSAAPAVNWSLDTNSNRRLDYSARDSQAFTIDGSVALRRAIETLDLSVTPRFNVHRYQGESVLDSNDYGLDLDARRSGELTIWGLQASAAREGTLTSELRDTGIIEGRQQRQSLVGTLSLSRALSPRISLSASAGWQGVSYQNAVASGLVDYRYPNASAVLTWMSSPNTKISLKSQASELLAPDIALTSRSHSERLVAETRLSERWVMTGALGRSATTARSATDSGLVYSATARWSGQLTEISLSAGRDVVPTGRGVLVARDDINASFARQLSSRLSCSFSASYNRNEDLLFGFIRNDRRYWATDAGLNWHLTETWTASARIAVSQASYDLIQGTAQSHSAAISFSWAPYKRALSR